MAAAGVSSVARTIVDTDGADHTQITNAVRAASDRVLLELYRDGADFNQRVTVVIGSDHPDFPGKLVVEAKAAAKRVERVAVHDDCPGCPIEHGIGD